MTLQAPEPVPEPTLDDLLAASWMTPPVPLPANLIQFPRELVASRRARPKLAEGPLRASRSASAEAVQAQLRIFEVDPEVDPVVDPVLGRQPEPTVSAEPAASAEEAENAACTSIWIWAHNRSQRAMEGSKRRYPLPLPLPAAAFHRRLIGFFRRFFSGYGRFFCLFIVFALSTTHLPTGKPLVIMSGIVYLALWLLYQFLFFTLSTATAGMSYARIALCTFEDENPSRRSLQRRIVAWWSGSSLGLGFAWTLLDEDRLGLARQNDAHVPPLVLARTSARPRSPRPRFPGSIPPPPTRIHLPLKFGAISPPSRPCEYPASLSLSTVG